jgi:hypothetical protein
MLPVSIGNLSINVKACVTPDAVPAIKKEDKRGERLESDEC